MPKDRPRIQLQLKHQVRETLVINGFSYPFLRLLVSKARELYDTRKLILEDHRDGRITLTGVGLAILIQIEKQIMVDYGSWGSGEVMTTEEVIRLIENAETFLAIFEEKT